MTNSTKKNQEVKMSKATKIISLFVMMSFFAFSMFALEESSEIKCPRKVKVQVEKINSSEFTIYKNFTAEFLTEVIAVNSKVAGAVTKLSVSVGDELSKDFPIAQINNALADDIAKAEKDKKSWERKLWQRENWKVRSAKAEAQAKNKIQELTSALEELQGKVNDYIILSPVQGQVKSLNVSQGQTIEEGTLLIEIVNPKKEIGQVSISGNDGQLFSNVSEIPVKIDGSDSGLKAQVKKISADQVTLIIEDISNQIEKDFSMDFSLEKETLQDVVVLHQSKLLSDENGHFVYTVNGKFAKKSYLKTGPQAGDLVLVKFGLKIGEEIITTEIQCLEEGKRIQVMIQDASGNLVKRKPGQTMKPVKVVSKKKTEVKKPVKAVTKKKVKKLDKEYKNYFKLGLGAGISMFSDENFKDVYGSSGFGVLFNFSYQFINNYEVFLNIGYLTKTGTIPVINEEVNLTMMPTYIGFKYVFDGASLRPFVGLSAVIFAVKEEHKYNPDPALDTGYGFALLTGAYLELSPNFDLFADLRYEIGSKEIEGYETDDSANRNKFKIHFGFNYKF